MKSGIGDSPHKLSIVSLLPLELSLTAACLFIPPSNGKITLHSFYMQDISFLIT